MKRLLPLLLLLAAAAPAQQTSPETDAGTDRQLTQQLEERFLEIERRVYDQNELVLRRTELVEQRIDSSQHHVDRVLLIFALAIAVIFLFIITHLNSKQKTALDRVARATADAENLMRDIQREINRPEMQHLRISQILRRLMRQLRDQSLTMSATAYIADVRDACTDPYLPVSLHFFARILAAEYDGNWNIAAQMLEQMREMDPQDPDILLHLSHVHKNIAARSGEGKTRTRHQRLSYQYYGQFTATMQAEGLPIHTETAPSAAAIAPAPGAGIPLPAAPPIPANVLPAAIPVPSSPPRPPAQPLKTALAQVKNIKLQDIKKLSVRDTLAGVGKQMAKTSATGAALAKTGITGIGKMLERDDGQLPFLPVPAIAEVPSDAAPRDVKMWQEIRQGDTAMARATGAKTLRTRNRIIDSAITSYTQAQSHGTNRVLYYNWGVALLAKALHVGERKRTPLYNAAIDKFMAGNVVAPHFFDFHLASLYAIIGKKDECKRWLDTARDHGGLDSDALRQAPDFDAVRNEPWFDQFLEG